MILSIAGEAIACRKRFEKVPIGTLVHLLHHDCHYELLQESAVARITYIVVTKPRRQIAKRLHYFGPMLGTPSQLLIACQHAEEQRAEALAAAATRWRESPVIAQEQEPGSGRYLAALAQYVEAQDTAYAQCGKACTAIVEAHPAVKVEHDRLWPDCPWDGKTMLQEDELDGI